MMKRLAVAAILAAVSSAPAFADGSSTPTAAPPTPVTVTGRAATDLRASSAEEKAGVETATLNLTTAKGDEVVCRTETATGMRISSRVCATRRQWEARSSQGRQALEKWQGFSGNPCSSDHC